MNAAIYKSNTKPGREERERVQREREKREREERVRRQDETERELRATIEQQNVTIERLQMGQQGTGGQH